MLMTNTAARNGLSRRYLASAAGLSRSSSSGGAAQARWRHGRMLEVVSPAVILRRSPWYARDSRSTPRPRWLSCVRGLGNGGASG